MVILHLGLALQRALQHHFSARLACLARSIRGLFQLFFTFATLLVTAASKPESRELPRLTVS